MDHPPDAKPVATFWRFVLALHSRLHHRPAAMVACHHGSIASSSNTHALHPPSLRSNESLAFGFCLSSPPSSFDYSRDASGIFIR